MLSGFIIINNNRTFNLPGIKSLNCQPELFIFPAEIFYENIFRMMSKKTCFMAGFTFYN